MQTLVSTWANGRNMPPNYIFPPSKRPAKDVVPTSKDVPVIDIGKIEGDDRTKTIEQIVKAAQDFGAFQVINHGVPMSLMDDAMSVFKEFFELPIEEKSKYFSRDLNQKCILYTSSLDYDKEACHYWRDAIKHSFLNIPTHELVQHWPLKPLRYREVVEKFIAAQSLLGSRILDLICEGLGLEPHYFEKHGICEIPNLTVNYYPACPAPSLTLGAGEHSDPGLITLLVQDDVHGLQALKDGKWFSIEPNPGSFLLIIGNSMEIVSNGKFKSLKHRVVTNAVKDRTSTAFFIESQKDCIIEPAKALIGPNNPPLFKSAQYVEHMKAVRAAFTGDVNKRL